MRIQLEKVRGSERLFLMHELVIVFIEKKKKGMMKPLEEFHYVNSLGCCVTCHIIDFYLYLMLTLHS